jgi:hypothetical protein
MFYKIIDRKVFPEGNVKTETIFKVWLKRKNVKKIYHSKGRDKFG